MDKSSTIDRIDLRILAQLQDTGRLTYQELGDRVGLSASPCLQRVKRLEKLGYILGYNAWVDLNKLREMTAVFTSITLHTHTQADFLRFESALRGYPELIECHLVSSGFDYLLKWDTRSVSHYQSIIDDLLVKNLGINKYFSYIVLKTPIQHRFSRVQLTQSEPL